MKHEGSAALLLQTALQNAGVQVSQQGQEALVLHLEAVLEANEAFNLTAVRNLADAVELHVVDSLMAAPEVLAAPGGELADLGSGAGYPGIPLALVVGRTTTLVESVGKKAEFLRGVADLLQGYAPLLVAHLRTESLAAERPRAFAVVTARALTSLPSLVELAAPLLESGGVLVAMKGRLSGEEVQRGTSAGRLVGMELTGRRDFELPSGQRRSIIEYRLTGESRVVLPRQPGKAQRAPLA